ncbi:glycoside hydrolase family 43 protein [Flavivirga sp. Y03]|uniref:Glycoside hydrolase family 43 protein n=2 Tax=Flavivirga algicola TaxID=2729136 RepID=A0ABX1RTL8_9FLAO|nr:glycoside hydrolase family 43 protein [Flavivirga algicola]
MKCLQGIFLLIISVFGLFCNDSYSQSVPKYYQNPILSGFYPDPSICRVGDDYYMVNSSFEWFPAIPIHHSKDLVNWKLIGHGLTNKTQINIHSNVNNSRGIYAPTIRYHSGIFYIISTCVECGGNFYITSKSPTGPWSHPIWLEEAPGIDPSLFWDDDGQCYYIGNENVSENTRRWIGESFIWMQEIDLEKGKLIGERKTLTYGHAINARWTEAPHLYKINGKYLLMVAEGGSSHNHATTVFHSDNLWGPYIADQANPVFTHRHLGKNYPLWAVGHTDLVQTQKGDWWAVLHAKHRVDGYSILARETYLVSVTFQEQTPLFNPEIGILESKNMCPDLPWSPNKLNNTIDNFQSNELNSEWNFLRTPQYKWYSFKEDELVLDVRPKKIERLSNPSFIAKRVTNHEFIAKTTMKFKPKNKHEKAGIVLYRNANSNFQFLKQKDSIVLIKNTIEGKKTIAKIKFKSTRVILKIEAYKPNLATFSFSEDGLKFEQVGESQDLSNLADEIGVRFNGLYIGMYATSSNKLSKNKAYFDWFVYK